MDSRFQNENRHSNIYVHAYKILAKTHRNAYPSLKYTLFLGIHLKRLFILFCIPLLSVTDPHQELCHWTQASMQTLILGWQNLSILLCVLCVPVQTVINLPVHRSYRSLGNNFIKQ